MQNREFDIDKVVKIKGRKMMNWKAPGLIFILLMLAMAFRWEFLDTHGFPHSEMDRWNGIAYAINEDGTLVIGDFEIYKKWYRSENLTTYWKILMSFDLIWFFYAVGKTEGKEEETEGNLKN